MDVIAANFANDAAAAAAVRDLAGTMHISRDRIEVEHLGASADRHAGEPLIVVWVRDDERERARELIERHEGRHVPFDWAQAVNEQVTPESVPQAPRMPSTKEAAESTETPTSR